MQHRIIGTDTDYSFSTGPSLGGEPHGLQTSTFARTLVQLIDPTRQGSSTFLENGAKVSVSPSGDQVAYATPECRDFEQATICDTAGERVLEAAFRSSNNVLEAYRTDPMAKLLKRGDPNDMYGGAISCRENYLVEEPSSVSSRMHRLAAFLVSRQVYAGNGGLFRHGTGSTFLLSERAGRLPRLRPADLIQERLLLRIHPITHADGRYGRLQVTAGDPNMNQFANALKLGSTSFLLRMLEESPDDLPNIEIPHVDITMLEISQDVSCSNPVDLGSNRMSSIEIQLSYLEAARRFAQSHGCSDKEERLLAMWEDALTLLEGSAGASHRRCDWAFKLRLLTSLGLSPSDADSPMVLLPYSFTSPDSRYGEALAHGEVDRLFPDSDIAAAKSRPPRETRANVRGNFVRSCKKHGRRYAVDWTHLQLVDEWQRTVICDNPFASADDRVERLLNAMARSL